MTEAGWTRERPTEAGWYWNRINGTVGMALIMRRDCQLYAWLRFKDAWLSREGWLDYIHGEWLGPITPDSYQQGRVAGLVRGAQLVRWHKSCAFEADPAFALERAAKDIESVASQIIQPQQAQDEKGVGDDSVQ